MTECTTTPTTWKSLSTSLQKGHAQYNVIEQKSSKGSEVAAGDAAPDVLDMGLVD